MLDIANGIMLGSQQARSAFLIRFAITEQTCAVLESLEYPDIRQEDYSSS